MSNGRVKPEGWSDFFDAVAGLPARETLVRAAEAFEAEGRDPRGLLAVDLGCGEGRDSAELLRRGWSVVAIDGDEDGIRRLRERVTREQAGRLRTVVSRYEGAAWPECDLVNASFSIPHCDEGSFAGIWGRIVASVREGGRFAGQLFGVRDGWTRDEGGASEPRPGEGEMLGPGWRNGREFHTREEVETMLREAGLTAEFLDEVERMGKNALGDPKYWHVFHIVAKKR